MLALTVPKIFFNVWFWIGIMAIVIAIHYFCGKTPPSPKPSKFYNKHKKTITKIMDVCIICFVLVGSSLLMVLPVIQIFHALYAPQPVRAIDLHFAWASFFINMIIVSGWSGMFIGLLSVFQSNLTKVKRIILLIICLLPIAFTVLEFLIEVPEKPWVIIQICLQSSSGSWIVNGPAIIIGKHFFWVAWATLRALRLVSGEYHR